MNKKFLLGTTSLVAATVLAGGNALAEAQPLNISLSGGYNFDLHLYEEEQQGGNDNHGMVTAQDAEINFNMRRRARQRHEDWWPYRTRSLQQ